MGGQPMPTFKEAEQTGWIEKAAGYDSHFASITAQAINPALDLLGDIAGSSILDLCCGTGDLAAAALRRGAKVTGIDFAPTMIEIASKKVPAAMFQEGDAEELLFQDAIFDAVICSFGLWHMAEPDKAICETARVLKPGGTFVYTTWLPPTKGWDMFEIVVKAIKEHGSMDVELPPSPPPFRFADEAEADRALSAQGFRDIAYREMIATWTGESGQDVLDMIYKAIVRTPMMIEAQSPKARDAIKKQIVDQSEAMRTNGKIKMRWPYSLVSAARS
jgi:ubiquinone/menaquinone biosynthesis C-methylase UbiE